MPHRRSSGAVPHTLHQRYCGIHMASLLPVQPQAHPAMPRTNCPHVAGSTIAPRRRCRRRCRRVSEQRKLRRQSKRRQQGNTCKRQPSRSAHLMEQSRGAQIHRAAWDLAGHRRARPRGYRGRCRCSCCSIGQCCYALLVVQQSRCRGSARCHCTLGHVQVGATLLGRPEQVWACAKRRRVQRSMRMALGARNSADMAAGHTSKGPKLHGARHQSMPPAATSFLAPGIGALETAGGCRGSAAVRPCRWQHCWQMSGRRAPSGNCACS